MPKTSEDIIKDLKGYFDDPTVNGNRWKLQEVSIKFNRKNNAIEILTILLPYKKDIKSLAVLD